MQNTFIKISAVILCLLLLSGCSVFHMYRFNIQQGNALSPSMLAQLRVGQTADQVRYIMGTPVLMNTFNPYRWDYVYTYKPGYGKYVSKRITLYFNNGILQQIDGPY